MAGNNYFVDRHKKYIDDEPMSARQKMNFSEAMAFTAAIGILWPCVTELVRFLLLPRLRPEFATFGSAIVAALCVITFVILAETFWTRRPLKEVLNSLGLKPGNFLQVILALIGMIPIGLGYFLVFSATGASPTTVPFLSISILKFIFAQGIVEEVAFRGFIYRHLRASRSFFRSTALSGFLFGIIHLSNFSKGFSSEILIGVIISTLFAFVLTFPLSALFEIGSCSILGGAILHVGIDSVNWFTHVTESSMGIAIYLSAVVISAVIVTTLALKKFLPSLG